MPLPANEAGRLAALRRYQILDTLPEAEFNRLTELASLICQTPISLVSLLDEHRQWFKARMGLEISETSRDIAFCRYAIMDQALLEVEDATRDERFYENPLVTADPHIRFYAGYPLTDPHGFALGTLCVMDRKPRKLTEDQRRSLQLLAQTATDLIVKNRQKQEVEQLESLFVFSNDLLCIAGTDGYFKKINPAFQQVLGWEESYLLKTPFFDLIHPDDLAETYRMVEELKAGNRVINFSNRFRCNTGTYRLLQWVATPEPMTGFLFAIARDITEAKQKEFQLYQSENKFRSFFENSQGLMCIHDLEGRLLTVNTAGAHALGYEPEELVGMNLSELIPTLWNGELTAYLENIRQTGRATGLMYTRHRDGSILIWLFNNVLENDLNGQTFVIGNAIDITLRYQLETDLNRTKEMLEQTNEVARIGTWEINVPKQTIYWSSVTKAIHGVSDDFVPDYESAVSFFKEENYLKITSAIERAIQEGVPYDLELQIVTYVGKPIWVRVQGTSDWEEGVCKRLYGIIQDIDEKKRAEQELLNEKLRLAAFVEHAPAAVAMFDRDIRYVAVSHRWMEEYQLTESVIGRSHYEVFPNISDEWRAIHTRCVQGAVEKSDEDIWRPAGWDYDQHLRWEVRPWYQFDGSIGGIMMFTQDITEMCQQRDELKKAKQLAEQASRAKSEFLANMSHEIRTPLNGVIGFTDLVLKSELNPTQQQYLSIVSQSANSLLGIINDILDFSKIEAGKVELVIEKTDLYEISNQAIDMVSYQARNKELEVLMDVAADLPQFVYTDAIRIKQVLVNLLGNAVKFTERGEIELRISLVNRLSEGKVTCRFEVRDTGIGIKPEMQGKIFDAFSQEDPSTTKKYGGTGLGLTISNKLLELMGSRLQLTSTPGLGSCFYFEIQLRAEEKTELVWPSHRSIRTVLMVDDNERSRHILRELLRSRQIQVVEASNGFEALQILARKQDFDALIIDYHMPYMDGLETVRKVRSNFTGQFSGLPVILLHHSPDDEKMVKTCEALGNTQRLLKPARKYELLQALGQLVRQEEVPARDRPIPESRVASPAVKVLIAEDNKINLLLAKVIVNRLLPNARVIEATNGQEAVDGYRREHPQIILMDIQMPVMNGYEATEKIRQLEPVGRTPIIALTAGTVKGEKEKCLSVGMDDFLTKPIVESTLASLFNFWLGIGLNQQTDA
ncbi:PAS domain S-box protein [Larkinella sp. VNQ87]|uniref:PAS domain S-box protein n=1 Tax=Larkinella sp. VNQ87 TaxID=3400921 RepID=UPI003C0B878F